MTLPSTADLVAALRRALGARDHPHPDPLVALLLDLHRTNRAQWDLEDDVRSPHVDDATVAGVKRAIDELNAQRHHLVEAIDAAIDRAIAQTRTAPPATESPAQVLDRLSVLVIRIHHTELAAASGRADAGVCAARLPVLQAQLAVLEEALDALLREVRDGTRRFVPYQSLKLYAPSRAAKSR